MRPLAPALSLVLLAGCLAPAGVAPSGLVPATPSAASAVRFLGDGTLVAGDVVGTATYVLTGHEGAEPNVGVTKSGAVFVTAGNEVLKSTDGGLTWAAVYDYAKRYAGYGTGNYDPMLWVDPVTDVVHFDPMFPVLACSSLVSSADDGATWTERPLVCHPPPMDHQRLGSGLPGPEAPPLAGVLHPTVLYQCYNHVVETNCAVSYDGGLDWAVHTVAANAPRDGCGGLNGSPRAGPDGVVVVPMTEGCDTLLLAVSGDNGLTWSIHRGPEAAGGGLYDPAVAFTPDGTMYVTWGGSDGLIWLARSKDHGATWDGAWRVTPPDVKTAVFDGLAAGADGRVAAAFIGTRDGAVDPSEAPADTRWHLFVTTSDDADAPTPTFASRQVTADDDPVQIGCIWLKGFTVPGSACRNMADFIDAAAAPDGTFYAAYTKGCTEGCSGNPSATDEDSHRRDVAVARLDGWTLGVRGPAT